MSGKNSGDAGTNNSPAVVPSEDDNESGNGGNDNEGVDSRSARAERRRKIRE